MLQLSQILLTFLVDTFIVSIYPLLMLYRITLSSPTLDSANLILISQKNKTTKNPNQRPITDTFILFSHIDDSRWETITKTTTGTIQDFTVSYQSLLPSTAYTFRVIAYNRYGISFPVYSKDSILTPSKLHLEYGYLQHKPFYRQTWFMVALAATSIVIIIMVIAVLCVKSKSYKYKRK